MMDTLAQLNGIQIGGAGADGFGVKDGDISNLAHLQTAPVGHADHVGTLGGDTADGLFQRAQLVLPGAAEKLGNGGVGTGVGLAGNLFGIAGIGIAVRADAHILRQEVQHILLAHDEEDAAGTGLGAFQNHRCRLGIVGGVQQLFGNIPQGLAHDLGPQAAVGIEQAGFGTFGVEVMAADALDDLLTAGACQKVHHCLAAALLAPLGAADGQAGAGGDEGIHIGGDVDALGPGLFQNGPHFGGAAVNLVIVHLQVGHVNVNARGAAHAEQLFDGFVDVQAFVAHMAGNKAVKLLDHLAQLPQLFGRGKEAGGIFQTKGQAPGAVLQISPQQCLHLLQLFGGHLTVFVADGTGAQTAVTHQNGLVDGHLVAALLKFFHEIVEGFKIPAALGGILQIGRGLCHPLGQSGEGAGATLTADLGGHTLIQLGSAAAVPAESGVRVGMGVDEAGRNDQAGCIQFLCSLQILQIADVGDDAILDGNICFITGGTGTVDDRAAANDQILHKKSSFFSVENSYLNYYNGFWGCVQYEKARHSAE